MQYKCIRSIYVYYIYVLLIILCFFFLFFLICRIGCWPARCVCLRCVPLSATSRVIVAFNKTKKREAFVGLFSLAKCQSSKVTNGGADFSLADASLDLSTSQAHSSRYEPHAEMIELNRGEIGLIVLLERASGWRHDATAASSFFFFFFVIIIVFFLIVIYYYINVICFFLVESDSIPKWFFTSFIDILNNQTWEKRKFWWKTPSLKCGWYNYVKIACWTLIKLS